MGDKSSLGWHIKKFNLSSYRGEDVRIKFNFCSDNSEEREGWYIDDVKIYKDADSSSVSFFDDFERLGHKWVDARDWVHEGSATSDGKRDVDIVIIEGTSSDVLINKTINKEMKVELNLDESSGSVYDTVYPAWWYTTGVSYNASGKFSRAITFDGSNDYLYNYNDYISAPDYRYKQITICLLYTSPSPRDRG